MSDDMDGDEGADNGGRSMSEFEKSRLDYHADVSA